MSKQPFTTRIDAEILKLARRIAASERRSITSLIEVALLEYAEKAGFADERRNNELKSKERSD
ncbi:hypothetical protein ACMDCR_10450 [Labrys okinawensis]|uniref:hypothetical protein n=1 Tax=Labrys okinawensis TaxID=346911 RepID=UPI0039BD4221